MQTETSFEISSSSKSTTTSNTAVAIRVLRVADIMFEDRGWTRGHATCSFDDVPPMAPGFLAYGALRLAAEGVIDPGAGYPLHAHAEVETITIMLSGTLAHEDTVLGSDLTGPSDVAVLSAGTGMQHAEMVHGDEPARAILFWLRSSPAGEPPRFAKRSFDRAARRNRLVALASGRAASNGTSAMAFAGAEDALHVRSDSAILSAILSPEAEVTHAIAAGRRVYLMATDGAIEVNGIRAEAGDRVLAERTGSLTIRSVERETEVFVVDLEVE